MTAQTMTSKFMASTTTKKNEKTVINGNGHNSNIYIQYKKKCYMSF